MATRKTAPPADEPESEDTEQPQDTGIAIAPIEVQRLYIPIVGTAPLIVHAWSQKARQMMLDNMQGRRVPKEPKNPEAEFQASMYHLDDGSHGFPTVSFKSATVEASRLFGKNVSKVGLKQSLFFRGEHSKSANQSLVRLVTPEPEMREDVCRVGMGGTDLRYRAMYPEGWEATLEVIYVRSALTQESVVSLVQAGGTTVGVGEWRPAKSGDFGTFTIDNAREVVAEQ